MRIKAITIGIGLALMGLYNAQAQDIYTVAGNGSVGYLGNGGPATSAEFYSPSSVTFDSYGNYYVADEQNNVVRKINTSGIISTVAGNGAQGFSGDGGYATSAELYWTISVAFDNVGNMYISDRGNQRIRKVNISGIISTFAGTGNAGYNGDGIQASTAEINNPDDITVYAGNLYIADFSNNRIRQVNLGTGIITTVAGTGTGGFSGDGGLATSAKINGPYGVSFDNKGNMYIGDQGNYCVREVAYGTGIITTVAGMGGNGGFSGDGGPATSAQMSAVTGLAIANTGDIYIADTPNQRVRKVNGKTGVITTVAGTGTAGYNGDGIAATSAELYLPNEVTLDSCGDLYIPDWANQRIREIMNEDAPVTITGKTPVCQGAPDTLVATGGQTYKWSNGSTTSSIIVSLASTTTYSVAITNTCSNIVKDTTIKITVTPLAISVKGKDSLCLGNSTTLTASGGSSYKWSNGSTSNTITIKPLADTTYSVLINNNGCSKDTSIKVTVNPLPSVSLAGKDSICTGGSTTLYVSGGGTYKWSNGLTTSAITVNPVSSTIYSVAVSNNACSKDTSIKVTVNPLPLVSFAGKDSICTGGSTTLYVSGGGTYKWSNGLTTSTITVNPVSSTIYSIAVSNNGCSKDTSIKVTVNSLPSISLAGEDSICTGNSTTLYVSGGGTYKWSSGSTSSAITVSPVSNTIYSVTVSNHGCSKDTSILINVSKLTASITASLSICLGDTVTLHSSGGGTYKWSTGSSANSISVKPASTTTYSVIITNGPCVKDTSVTVTVENCSTSGIENYHPASSFVNIFPNPNNGNFTLSLSNVNEKCSIHIYNVLGQQVYQSNINSDNTEINLGRQPNGIYLYRVVSETGDLVGEGKVVVQ